MEATKGKLKELKYLDSEHKSNRWVVLAVLICSFVFSGYVYFSSEAKVDKERSRIYVLENGKALLMASREDMSDNRPAEIKHHIKMVMGLIFTVSPDKAQIEDNIGQVLYLGDNSIKSFIDQLKEKKYYDQLIAASASQSIKLDTNSIQLDVSTYPIKALVKAKEQIVRISNVTEKELTCSMDLRNVARSDNNPHGLLVENFTVLSNENIQVRERKQESQY